MHYPAVATFLLVVLEDCEGFCHQYGGSFVTYYFSSRSNSFDSNLSRPSKRKKNTRVYAPKSLVPSTRV